MIFADKIILLRKKNGWSQEELAEKMNVSRQSVSKWEGAQSIPDLEKILQLGEIFGVTTDYLLKDEIEDEEYTENTACPAPVRRVSMEAANEYLSLREEASKYIAAGTFLCIISPICLLIFGAASQLPQFHISENFAGGIGLIVLFLHVAAAVGMFIYSGGKSSQYEFLKNEPFETEYGVAGMVKEKKKEYKSVYMKSNIMGTVICILSPIPLLIGAFTENEFIMVILLCVTMVMAAVGVIFFITAGVKWGSMEKLLQEGEYAVKNKRSKAAKEKIAAVYWLAVTAAYLGWSFYAENWAVSWIIWPVAGVIFAAFMIICSLLMDKEQ